MDIIFTIDPLITIQLVLSVFLPIVVGLVTTRVTSGAIKAWLLAALSLITAILTQVADAIVAGGVLDLGLVLLTTIPTFAISVATYYGLWKPTGIAASAQDFENTTLPKFK